MHRTRLLVLMGIFIALAIGGGLALIQVPNVELVTATIFLSGLMLGTGPGLCVGVIAEFLYSLFNPYGVAAPPIMLAQVFAMALTGAAGGWARLLAHEKIPPAWLLAVLGLCLTVVFDLATTLGGALMIGQGLSGFFAALAFGIPFYATHVISNALIFALLLPVLARRLQLLEIFRARLALRKFT